MFLRYIYDPTVAGVNVPPLSVLPSNTCIGVRAILTIFDSTLSTVNESDPDNDNATLNGPGSVVALALFDDTVKVVLI